MANVVVSSVKSGNIVKKIRSLRNFLRSPVKRDIFNKRVGNMQAHWKTECRKTFTVRSGRGLSTDNLVEKSLGVEIRKNSVIVYVKPIIRESKTPYYSSGGTVRNLTTILFNGSRSSFGRYSPRWDCRVNTGVHPGTSPSPMRNMWKRYKGYVNDKVRDAMRECLIKERNRK